MHDLPERAATTDIDELARAAGRPHRPTRYTLDQRVDPAYTAELFQKDYRTLRPSDEIPWPEVGVGAALGAGVFPGLLAVLAILILFPIALFSGELRGVDFVEFLGNCVGFLGGVLIASSAAFMVTGFVATIVLSVAALVMRLLGARGRLTPVACFSGGLVLFVTCSPVWLTLEPQAWRFDWWMLLFCLGLATAVGQIGAGWMAMHNETVPWLRRFLKQREERPAEPVQFSIWQLLVLMTVASVLFAVLQLAGLLRPNVFVAIAVWTAFQFLPLWLSVKLIDWRMRRYINLLLSESESDPAPDGADQTDG